MSEFAWGVVSGGVASPFVWEGLKWCYIKFTRFLDQGAVDINVFDSPEEDAGAGVRDTDE
tara:strand:- start:378 stop:557 length:180 start_codon:yes stop_codon:yes gene_type:complete